MEKGFRKGLGAIKKSLKKWHPKDSTSMAEEAFWLSKKAHEDQYRKSGEPYFIHPVSVAKSLAEEGLDETVVTAGLLHDIVEDTDVSGNEVKRLFGNEVYSLVEGVTKLDKHRYGSEQEYTAATTIKTILASYRNLRALIIKLFDKLHNMRTIKYLSRKRQRAIAADTLTIYVPLAHKLGMHRVKNELEELAFKTIEPKKYAKLKKLVQKHRKRKSTEVKKAIKILRKNFMGNAYRFEEFSKPVYEYYSKMMMHNKGIDEINDLSLVRLIVPDNEDCYRALGKVYKTFKPIPFKLKDYVAIPDCGIYRALHLQVIGPEKRPLKIYVMTREMGEIADSGILYYQRNRKKHMGFISRFREQLRQPIKEARTQKELAGSLDLDFHNKAMIVFTTQGKIISLPSESTALDFSFFSDEKKAPKSIMARINGKNSPLWKKLRTGDRASIIYSRARQLNSNWLSYVESTKAKNIIDRQLVKRPGRKTDKELVKFRIESVDKMGLLGRQASIMAKNKLNIRTAVCKMNDDNATAYTEIFAATGKDSRIQRAIDDLKKLGETLNVSVSFTK